MHLSLLCAFCLIVLTSAAPESLQWQSLMESSKEDDAIKFHSPAEIEDEWQAFKFNYGKSKSIYM